MSHWVRHAWLCVLSSRRSPRLILCISFSWAHLSAFTSAPYARQLECWRILNSQAEWNHSGARARKVLFKLCYLSVIDNIITSLPWRGLLSPVQTCRASRGPVAFCPRREAGRQACPAPPWSSGIAPPSPASRAPRPARTGAWFARHWGWRS